MNSGKFNVEVLFKVEVFKIVYPGLPVLIVYLQVACKGTLSLGMSLI